MVKLSVLLVPTQRHSASSSLSHMHMHSWSDLRPEGAVVFVWAHGGQAPEEMTLGLAFFPLPWHLLPGQPSCQLTSQLQPHRLAQGWH